MPTFAAPASVAAPPTVPATGAAIPSDGDVVGTRGIIKGTVLDSSGTPVADAAVVIVEGTSPWPEMATFSSASGGYQWLVEAGTYTLEASRDGVGVGRGEITVGPGAEATLELRLSAP
jgi:hypothetical protein